MSAKPWQNSKCFHHWFIEQIDVILAAGPPMIRVSGRNRPLEEDDFGFTSKTLDNWKNGPPRDEYPDGRKMMGIVVSKGFDYLDPEHQHAIICQWIAIELEQQSDELTDELIGMLLKVVEKSPKDFLMECLAETQNP